MACSHLPARYPLSVYQKGRAMQVIANIFNAVVGLAILGGLGFAFICVIMTLGGFDSRKNGRR